MSEASCSGVCSSSSFSAVTILLSGRGGGRPFEGPPYLVLAEGDTREHAGRHVAARNLGFGSCGVALECAADLELHPLRLLVADQQAVLFLDEADDRVVHVVAAHRQGGRNDDPTEGDHRHLARAAADVDDEGRNRIFDRQAGADRSCHRLLDQVRLARSRRERGLDDGIALDLRQPARDADDHGAPQATAADEPDELAEHLLGRLEVCDHAVPQRPGRDDRRRGATEHLPRLLADRIHLSGLLIHRHDRRLEEDDALAAAENDRVRRPEVDREIGPGCERRQSHTRFSTRPPQRRAGAAAGTVATSG